MRRPASAAVRQLVWDRMREGAWPPGSRIPTERALAQELGVHRSTVAAVYDDLAADGILDRRQGSGTYVHQTLWGVAPNWTRYLATAAARPSAALMSQVRAARVRRGILDLTRADPGPDFWPHEALTQLWHALDVPALLEYGPPEGAMALREAASLEMARRTGRPVSPTSVLITAGASQALYLVARGLLKPGDSIAMESPSFYYSLPLFQSCGIRLLPIQMDREGLRPDVLEDTLRRHRPAMVWVNPTHHNPTGTVLSAERRTATLELAARWQVPVLEDDAFNGLDLPGAAPPAPLYREGGSPHVIYVGTVSKSVAPGLRVGWMVAPDPVIRQLADVKGQMDLGTPLAMQALAAAWLTHPARAQHESALGRRLWDRLEIFQQALKPLHALGAAWDRPTGGFYQWLRWPEGKTDREWLAIAVHQAGLVFSPGQLYGSPEGFARFNFAAAPHERVTAHLAQLADALS